MILQAKGGQAECFPSAVFAHGTFIRVRPAVRAVVVAHLARSPARLLLWVYNVVELAPRPRYVAVRPAEPTPRREPATIEPSFMRGQGSVRRGMFRVPDIPLPFVRPHADKPRQKGVAACGCSTGENMPKITCNSLILAVQA